MCTIYTFESSSWNIMLPRIKADLVYNRDGVSALIGTDCFIQSERWEPIATVVGARIASGWIGRLWIHLRASTTEAQGINGCHGFIADRYRVFHNGILSRPESAHYAVDSELIARDIDDYGIDYAMDQLHTFDHFANVIVVDTITGCYYVHRSGGGTLYTDGQGNYSTNAVGPITKKVGPVTTYYEGDLAKMDPNSDTSYTSSLDDMGYDKDGNDLVDEMEAMLSWRNLK